MHLLVQVVVALVLVHGFIDLLRDLLVDLQHPALAVHPLYEQAQTAQKRSLFQHGLLILKAEQEVGRDILAEKRRVVVGVDREHHILADAGVQAQQLIKALLHIAEQRVGLGLLVGLDGAHRRGTDRSQQEAAVGVHLGEPGAVFALHQDADEVVRYPHDLLDLGHDAVIVQAVGTGAVGLHILLCDQENVGVIADRPLHSGDALFAAHLKMKQVVGKDDKPPQSDGGQMEDVPLHPDRDFFRHMQNLLFFFYIVAQAAQSRQQRPERDGRQCAHHEAEHQHHRRIIEGDRRG